MNSANLNRVNAPDFGDLDEDWMEAEHKEALDQFGISEQSKYSMIIQWCEVDRKYLVSIPEFAGLVPSPCTEGTTYEEAAKNGQYVIDTFLEIWAEQGKDFPRPQIYPPKTFHPENLDNLHLGTSEKTMKDESGLKIASSVLEDLFNKITKIYQDAGSGVEDGSWRGWPTLNSYTRCSEAGYFVELDEHKVFERFICDRGSHPVMGSRSLGDEEKAFEQLEKELGLEFVFDISGASAMTYPTRRVVRYRITSIDFSSIHHEDKNV